jgi:lactam utilization protein B
MEMFGTKTRWLATAITCCMLTSCMSVISHDEKAAAKAATEFAQTAFIARDYSKAHGLLATRSQSDIPIDKLTDAITKMHPKSYPSKVTATEYEPLPGQRGMNIYVKGDGDGEDFFYRLVMEGDATAGYRVTGLFRGNGPNPSTNKRPLNL